ncbi:MAG: ABC transporter substrate-binding protein [Candidatus Binatia bacterium]
MKLLYLAISLIFFIPSNMGAQDKPRTGGTLNIGIHADLYGLNPFVRMRSIDRNIRSLVYESLVTIDNKGEVKPFLAESWKISPDGKEYTFVLRRGVKYHNGEEMTAEDIKWAVDYAKDPQHGASAKPHLDGVDSVRVVDKYTVRLVLKRSQVSFLSGLSDLGVLFVLPKNSIPTGQTKVQAMPPGTGPFVFKEWRAGSHTAFERHKDYWQKGLPYLDRVVMKPVPDASARLAALRAGDLHIITRVPSQWVVKIQKGEMADVVPAPAKYAGMRELYLNTVRPPYDNPKVRQAVVYAIDKQKILEGAYWGQGETTDERFYKGSPWNFGFPERKRDLAKAKALLKEAGYKGEKIVFVSRQGQDEVAFIVPMLQEAGLNVVVETLEAGTYRTRTRTGDYDMSPGGGDMPPDPAQIAVEFMCDEESVKLKSRDNNRTGYCNKQLDSLVQQADSTLDPKKRKEIYRKAFQILYDETPEVFLAFEHRFFGVYPTVRGFVTDSNESLDSAEGGIFRVWLTK